MNIKNAMSCKAECWPIKVIYLLFYLFYLYIYPTDLYESNRDADTYGRASDYSDLFLKMPKYCDLLKIY